MSIPQVPLNVGVFPFERNVWEKVPQVPLCPNVEPLNHDETTPDHHCASAARAPLERGQHRPGGKITLQYLFNALTRLWPPKYGGQVATR